MQCYKHKEIIKELQKITCQGYDAHRVFDDWIDLMFYALLGNDQEYLKVVDRYKNDRPQGEREIDHFCKAFAELLIKMKETNDEILGEIYQEWQINNKWTGQFFTPKHIAKLMAEITGPKKGLIGDPTCGSGIMLIEAAKTMTHEQCSKAVFVGQDLDFTCVKMCALNLTFFNLNGYVIWGNSLINERLKVFKTVRSYMGGSIFEIPIEQVQEEEIPEFKQAVMF